ncbi:hypothetical protein AUK10_02195 [Candidatus Gracilibacteria bacterium CG2_30_37_12]|nr:MAG: hypothetical protein AUK10_02195 [Candidatus Gracilibacteria bacterium CG2_30_37_12]
MFDFLKPTQRSSSIDIHMAPKPGKLRAHTSTERVMETSLERTPLNVRDIKRRVIRELNRGTRGSFCSTDFMDTDSDGRYFFQEIKEDNVNTGRIHVVSNEERMRRRMEQKCSGNTEVAFKVSSILNRLGMYPAPSNDEQDLAILKKNILKKKVRYHKEEIANIALSSGRNSFQFNQVVEKVNDLKVGDRIFLELGGEARAYSVTVSNASQEEEIISRNGKPFVCNFARCVLTYQSCSNGEDIPRQITNVRIRLPIVKGRACIVVANRDILQDLNRPVEKIYLDRAENHSKQ